MNVKSENIEKHLDECVEVEYRFERGKGWVPYSKDRKLQYFKVVLPTRIHTVHVSGTIDI